MISTEIEKGFVVEKGYSEKPCFENAKVSIEISGACNESCIYCLADACGKHKHPQMIEEELFYRVTREARELGATEIGLYTQGEPLTNPNISKFISYVKKELGYKYVYISSNGVLCVPQKLREIVNAGVDSIKFSISSVDRENFIRHHGVDGCDKCIENVRYAYEYRKEMGLDYKLYMFAIVTKYNEWELESIRRTYEPYVDELVFMDVIDGVYSMKGLSEYLIPSDGKHPCDHSGNYFPCPEVFNRIVINERGQLCACCLTFDDGFTVIKDLHDISLKEALYSDEMIQLRRNHIKGNVEGTICYSCVFKKRTLMKPLNDELGIQEMDTPEIDRATEIKRRFKIC